MKEYIKSETKKSMAATIVFLSLMMAGFMPACAPPSVKTTALVPARFDEAAKLKEVAVMPFEGAGGKEFAAEIEGLLVNINLHDKQYFTLVDRIKLDKIISEMKLSQSALVDANTAAKIGKLVGAKGIYTGVVTASGSTDGHYKEERSRCASTRTYTDKKGKKREECEKYEKYHVSCTKRNAVFTFIPKLIEVETGRVVYSNSNSGTATASMCEDKHKPLATGSELLDQAKQAAKAMFRNDIAPYYVQLEISLIDSTTGITSKEAEKKFEQGLEFAKNSRLDRACELWGEARVLSPNSLSILYSLGICAEVTGDVEKALDLYKQADRLLSSPDDKITAALGRVQKRIQDKERLKKQI